MRCVSIAHISASPSSPTSEDFTRPASEAYNWLFLVHRLRSASAHCAERAFRFWSFSVVAYALLAQHGLAACCFYCCSALLLVLHRHFLFILLSRYARPSSRVALHLTLGANAHKQRRGAYKRAPATSVPVSWETWSRRDGGGGLTLLSLSPRRLLAVVVVTCTSHQHETCSLSTSSRPLRGTLVKILVNFYRKHGAGKLFH